MKRHKIIVNPTSGRGNGARAIPRMEQWLRQLGLDFDVARTERPYHAAELAQQAANDGYDVVVAMGGDGTVNEVVNGLMQAKEEGRENNVAMGVLGVGRGNDFASFMGVPGALEGGCRLLAQGRRRAIDVGRVTGDLFPEGRYFGNSVGIGFDTVVGFEALKIKYLSGFPSYIVAALKTIFLYYRAPLVRIEYDGQTITQPALMVTIMNGRRQGGGFIMAPEAENDDGLFDLVIADEVSRARIFALFFHFLRGTQATQEAIKTGRARHVVITAVEGVLPAHADGETLCADGRRLTIELLPRQLDVISAAPGDGQ